MARSYLSCASLADALDVSESTIHEMVRRGVLPQPIRLSPGCVRWRWEDVDAALRKLSPPGNDPYLAGALAAGNGKAQNAPRPGAETPDRDLSPRTGISSAK